MTQSIAATITMSARMSLTVQASNSKWKKILKDYLDPDEKWDDQREFVIESYVEDMAKEEIGTVIEDVLSLIQFEDIDTLEFGRLSGAEVGWEEVSVHDNEEAN